jgi:MFS family permease
MKSVDVDTAAGEATPFSWRNYLAHSIEGGIYVAGLAFLAAETVMPAMVKSLGGPNWLVAMMPMMTALGFSWLPLLTAHRVERLAWVKPFICKTGVFQRLPYLIAGLILLLCSAPLPAAALYAVAFAPFISGAVGGISYSAWLELISKTIPERRRASAWAIRFVISGSVGIAAGAVISATLDRYPGPVGYGLLHLITFGFLAISYLIFLLIREQAPSIAARNSRKLSENLISIPALLRARPELGRFALSRLIGYGLFVMVPFLSIHALETLGKPESYLGALVTAQMIGAITGNFIAGRLGDTRGGKAVLIMALLCFFVCAAGAAVNPWEWGFWVIFFVFGMGFYMNMIGDFTMSMELCAPERRPTYLSLLASIRFFGMLLAAGLSALLRELFGGILPAALVASAALITSLALLSGVPEPRVMCKDG